MTESMRKQVEELLLSGDLLEVTTDETTQLWQVYNDSIVRVYFLLLCSCCKLIQNVCHFIQCQKRKLLLRIVPSN